MAEPSPPSSSSCSSSKNDTKLRKTTDFFPITDDLLQNILSRLPAVSFASAARVSKSWNLLCNQVLSRPKLASALSLDPSPGIAVREVVDKVLAEPIRPHFVIASVGSGFRLYEVFRLISSKLGSKTPVIISTANGIIGKDAFTDEVKEVKWVNFGGDLSDDDGSVTAEDDNHGIVLTVGFVPGLSVDVVPLLRPTKLQLENNTDIDENFDWHQEPRRALLDNFVTDIREYTASVSGCKSPVGIVLFGVSFLVALSFVLAMRSSIDYVAKL
ncbi:F-box domain containing protein [Parasponia andersonii]|uniref:F-box domain containing protein n=1 Tax=Parasponia andersonii TaxID=3476 RepID=A0A2P5DVE6_PARAD|nr:F-box domain containing protein [Parasponia andersonii]